MRSGSGFAGALSRRCQLQGGELVPSAYGRAVARPPAKFSRGEDRGLAFKRGGGVSAPPPSGPYFAAGGVVGAGGVAGAASPLPCVSFGGAGGRD